MTFRDVAPLPGFHPEIGILLASLNDSTREWRRHLGEVSVEALRWQPAPKTYSISTLLMHLIDVEAEWFYSFCAGHDREEEEYKLLLSEETIQADNQWPAAPDYPLEWYFETHDRIRKRGYEAIQSIDPEQRFERPEWGYTYTLRWVVAHVLEHDSYTGGQAVALHQLWKRMASGS